MSKPFRLLPAVGPDNEHYWRGGKDGELRFLHCGACSTYIHPPQPLCPECLGRDLAPKAVSGRGVVHTFTVNHPVPSATSLSPTTIVAGSGATTIAVSGSDFYSGCTVTLDGAPLATSFVNSGSVTAVIPAAELATARQAQVRVANPAPG